MSTELNPTFTLNPVYRPSLVMQASTLGELETQLHRDLFGPMDFHDYIVAHHEARASARIAHEMHMTIVRRVAARFAATHR